MPHTPNGQYAGDQSSLDRQRRLLDFAVSQSPAIFYIAELDGAREVSFISSNVETITGHAAASFTGDPKFGWSHIHPNDRAHYNRVLDDLPSQGSLVREYRFRTAAGEHLWFRDELRLGRDEATGRDEFVGCMIDITAEKQAEAQLREAEAVNAAIIKSTQAAIVTIDGDAKIIEFNPAAERMFGHARSAAIGRRVGELIIPKELREKHDAGLRRFEETGGSQVLNRRMETTAQRADGSRFPIELTIGRAQLGERTVFVGEIRDISERVEAETERDRLTRLLRDAIESLPNGFSIDDVEGRVVMCNTAFAAPYGLEPEAMIGRTLAQNVKDFSPKVRRFGGEPNTRQDGAEILERLRHADVEPVEIELTSGEWRLLSSVRTSDGGKVTLRTDITKLKQAEQALRESERRFRSIVEDHPLPVSLIDVETGKILYESPAAAALMGREWPPRGEHFVLARYVNPEARKAYVQRLRRDRVVRDLELEVKRTDGTKFWISINARLVVHEGREVAVTSHVDLTERMQREAELRHAQETLEDAIESLYEGFALYDAEDRLVMCNERFRELSQPTADILKPGLEWIDFARTGAERGQYPDAVGREQAWLKDWAAGRAKLPMSREFRQSDGTWIGSSARRTRHGGVVVTRSDISQHKEMERVLRAGEEQIRSVVEACPTPVVMTRVEDGAIIYASPALEELFGYRPTSVPHSARDFFADPRDRDRYVAALRARGMVDSFELKLKRADGSEFWGAVSARLIDYHGEEVIVANTVDLTERREVEAEMARQREALHQSEKLSALGELLAGVAHELNNPLSVVVGQALLLKETATEKHIAERAIKIGNAADRCARIVKTFLAMARRKPSESQAVDMNDVIETALEVTGYALSAAGIDVSLRLARDLPTIWADSDQLNQVITNLIVNAQHALQGVHGARKLRILSSFRKQKGEVVIKIKDNGRGISDEIMARVFEPFFTTKEVGTGTGIGLAVCHRIVEAHGGKIRVDSAPGEGASFVIRLPVAPQRPVAAAARDPRPGPAAPLAALVIDDEADVAEVLADILRGDGHSVAVADSGEAALSMLTESDFDVILSDLRMPGLDGPSLYRIIERRKPELLARLAFVTGDTLSPRIKKFLRGAGRPYIEKPISPQEVRELVRRVETRT